MRLSHIIKNRIRTLLVSGAVLIGSAQQYATAACLPSPAGQVGWWKGENNALDTVNGNHGITSFSYTPGEVGQAFQFGPNSPGILIPADSDLDVGTQPGFTLEFWMNPADQNLSPIVEFNDGAGNSGVHIWQCVDSLAPGDGIGNLDADIIDTTGGIHHIHTPAYSLIPYADNHVALTYDTTTGDAIIYVNGQAVVTQNLGMFTPQTSYDLYFGTRVSGPFAGTYYQGQLDEVSLYKRVLTSTEVGNIFAAGATGKASPLTDQVGWWKAENNATDAINGNNGSPVLNFATGEVGEAFVFGGSDYVKVPADSGLNVGLKPGFTLEFWMNPANQNLSPLIEFNDGSGNSGVHIWQCVDITVPGDGVGNLDADIIDTTGSVHHIHTPANTIPVNSYSHVALTYDTTSGYATIYVNGSVAANQYLGIFTPQTSYDLYFGTRVSGPFAGTYYQGQLDEISLYDRVLNGTEIGNIYGAGASGKCSSPFPVSYSANSRYLVDKDSTAFPILGRTAWFITSLTGDDYRTFIDDTAAKGYTAIEFHVINHDSRGNTPPYSGTSELPFLKQLDGSSWGGGLTYTTIANEAPDFTTPNEAYWKHVDRLLAYAESRGLLVFMFPAYVGYEGGAQGWMEEMLANGTTKMQAYGAWIANRYKHQKNLVWMLGGDMGTGDPFGTGSAPHAFSMAQAAVENALLTGMQSISAQPSVQFSAEWGSESIATDQTDTSLNAAMTLNGAYSWTGNVAYEGLRAYYYSPAMPAFLLEEPYDEEGPDGNLANQYNAIQPVRRFQWWGWLSTIGGYISGNGYVWPFNSGWQTHKNTQGAKDMALLNTFIKSIPWYTLEPAALDGSGYSTLVTDGSSYTVTDPKFVASAKTTNGKLIVAYIPPAHTGSITVDVGTSTLTGWTATWFDPVSGDISSATGTATATSNWFEFDPSSNNGTGQNSALEYDWVLVLERP